MGERRLLGLAAGTAAAVLLVGGIGTTAYAADVRSTVESALASLGVEASDELVDDLADEELLDDALEGGDEEGSEEEGSEEEGSEDGEEGDGAEEGEEELEESFLAWNERAELWRAAFAEVKAEFDACRTEAEGGKGDCAVAFSGRLQVAFAETLVEFLQSQNDAIAALPEEERAAAQAELDRRLEKALTKLERTQERVDARDAARLAKALDEVEAESGDAEGDAGEAEVETESSKPGKPEKNGGNGGGNGNGGGGGKPDHAGKPGGK